MFRSYGKVLAQLAGEWLPVSSYRLFDENETGDGDTGVEGASAGAGEHQVEGEEQPGGRVAGDKGVNGHMIPKSRFDEVNSRLAEYKKYGDPEAIRKLQERVAWMEKNPGKKFTDQQVNEIESELRQVPGLARAMQAAERWERFEAQQTQRYTDYGGRQTDTFLKELGRTPDDKNRAALSHAIAGIIQSDKAMLDRFYALDQEVFTDAFKEFKSQIFGNVPLRRTVPGADLQRVKQAPKAGQKPPAKKEAATDEPKTERELLDEASDAAFETLMDAAER